MGQLLTNLVERNRIIEAVTRAQRNNAGFPIGYKEVIRCIGNSMEPQSVERYMRDISTERDPPIIRIFKGLYIAKKLARVNSLEGFF